MLHHMATILVCYGCHFESKMAAKIQKSSDLGNICFPSSLCSCELIIVIVFGIGNHIMILQIISSAFTLNFLPYKPTGPVSSNIYRPTINSTGPNLKTTLMTINSNHQTQNMMMYQILCGHVNYALGKTRMQVKKTTKRHFILDLCLLLIS